MHIFLKGAGGLLPVAVILLFALALGDVANALGTGIYVASLVEDTIPAILLLPLLFLISGVIAFSIGSSWGTFAIMIPLQFRFPWRLISIQPYFSQQCFRFSFWRSCITDKRYHSSGIDGICDRSYRSCPHTITLCVNCGRDCNNWVLVGWYVCFVMDLIHFCCLKTPL
ncbi:MAG: hypothetical protein CM1200mP40_30280 [Gammaproteobacteria bacterium]|nr:MAG: hypothetical protein CM1200mP40_30280 [Gammaproteobacteria bacterium]